MHVHGTKVEGGVGKTKVDEQTAGMTAAMVAQHGGDLLQVTHCSQRLAPTIVLEVGDVEVIVGEEAHDGGDETSSSLRMDEVVAQRALVELVLAGAACENATATRTRVEGDPCHLEEKEVVAWRP